MGLTQGMQLRKAQDANAEDGVTAEAIAVGGCVTRTLRLKVRPEVLRVAQCCGERSELRVELV